MKSYIVLASLFAALAILFGAFGSHALKERLSAQSLEVYDIATRYLMFHALGIFLIALLASLFEVVILFSASKSKIFIPFTKSFLDTVISGKPELIPLVTKVSFAIFSAFLAAFIP